MKKLFIGLIAANMITASCALGSFAYDNPARDAAVNMMRQHDYDGALNKLDEAIGFNATDPELFMLRGKCFFIMHNYQLAIEDFNHVLQYSPNYYRAMLWRGTAHARLGNDDLAVADYQSAIKLRPGLARAYFDGKRGGLPGHKEGSGGPAVQDYKKAMSLVYPQGYNPNTAVAGTTDSTADSDDGSDEFADYTNASGDRGSGPNPQPVAKNRKVATRFDTDPDYGVAGAVPGSQPMKGDPKKTIEEVTEAIRMDATNPDYYYIRAKAYQALQDANKAFDDYNEAIRLWPKAKYYVGRASLFYQLNKPMLVKADIRSAIAMDPTTPKDIRFGGDKYPASVQWDADGPGGD